MTDNRDHEHFLCPDCEVTFVAREYVKQDGTRFWLDGDGNDCTERVLARMAEKAAGQPRTDGKSCAIMTTADLYRWAASGRQD